MGSNPTSLGPYIWLHRLSVRTLLCHSRKTGSIPVEAAIYFMTVMGDMYAGSIPARDENGGA